MKIRRFPWALVLLVGALASWPAGAVTELGWYGYYKLDLAYDSAESSHGNFAMWVKQHTTDEETSIASLTARQTRLGLNVRRDDMSGKLEFDFYGAGSAEHKANVQMRKAYVDVPLGAVSLRAGQDSDVISPLVPATINYTVCWGVGNVGYRRPQLRLYSQRGGLYWALAVARNISPDLNGDGIVDGDAGTPVVQGRFDFGWPTADMDVTIGVSGHYGLMDSPGAAGDDYETWSANGSVAVELTRSARFLAEVYAGSNMQTYFGSILNEDSVDGLTSLGGWANLQMAPVRHVTVSLGAGLDTVEEDDLAAGGRTSNMVIFANAQRAIASGVKAGLEASYWTTEYAHGEPGMEDEPTDLRIQFAVQGSF